MSAPTERAAALATADLVIGAILISTYDTPPMIARGDLGGMQPGAVIVDATCGYGPGYLRGTAVRTGSFPDPLCHRWQPADARRRRAAAGRFRQLKCYWSCAPHQ